MSVLKAATSNQLKQASDSFFKSARKANAIKMAKWLDANNIDWDNLSYDQKDDLRSSRPWQQ